MNRRNYYIAIVLVLLSANALAQEPTVPNVAWNGYTQFRFTSNFNDVNSFAMRRMKLWVNSTPGFSEHWGFHVQTTITSNQNEKFLLQDVMAFYKQGQFQVNMGQFVPQYSLQRFQPDFEIPLTERADVINALIPNSTLGVRDIGVEGSFSSKNRIIQSWVGVFNGNGIKEYNLNNSGILLTQKTSIALFNQHFSAGYSVMYRKADELQLSKILPDSIRYSGNDFRYNLFAQYTLKKFHVQTEYLWADLNGMMADGWYLLANINLGKNQLATSFGQYNDIITSTGNAPMLHFEYNYLVKGDKLKLMFDNGAKIDDGSIKDYSATLQLQLFFN